MTSQKLGRNHRRSELEMLGAILDSVRAEAKSKTTIANDCMLNYLTIDKYILFMLERGLLQAYAFDGYTKYGLTLKGQRLWEGIVLPEMDKK